MNKLTNILAVIIAIGVIGILIVSLNADQEVNINNTEQVLGSGIYNELGYSGMTHATSGISITVATGTTHVVLAESSGRLYSRIANDTADSWFTLQFGTSSAYLATTTQTFENNLVKGNGVILAPGESYVIGVDNLWKGGVVAIASSSATATISTIDK